MMKKRGRYGGGGSNRASRAVAGLCLLLFLSVPVGDAPAFSRGSARASIFFGTAVAFDQRYTVFGLGGGYFIADGIELGLDAESWSGNSPRIQQISPQIRAVLDTDLSVKPYVGIFYRRTLIEGLRDFETIGGRTGAYFQAGGNAYFGAGIVQDVHLNCDREVYSSCSETFPEVVAAFLF